MWFFFSKEHAPKWLTLASSHPWFHLRTTGCLPSLSFWQHAAKRFAKLRVGRKFSCYGPETPEYHTHVKLTEQTKSSGDSFHRKSQQQKKKKAMETPQRFTICATHIQRVPFLSLPSMNHMHELFYLKHHDEHRVALQNFGSVVTCYRRYVKTHTHTLIWWFSESYY